jgi:hypothetical protein
MPFFSPGSSQITITPTEPTPLLIDKLAALSIDEPLPEIAPTDRVRLLIQSPRRLYLYWSFAHDPFSTLRRAFAAQSAQYALVIRLVDLDDDTESWHIASPSRSQWFNVKPGKSYRADVGFYAQGRAFIRLLSSNVINSPRAGVAQHSDVTPQWKVSAEQFARVLDEAGYVSDALEVTLEAADEAMGAQATRTIAREFAGTDAPQLRDDQLSELRGLLVALALGVSYAELRATLSSSLSQWLEQISGEQNAALNSARIFALMHQTFGLELSRDTLNIAEEEAMRRVARFIVGASEVNLPSRPFHLWLPSMTFDRKSGKG